MHNWILEKPKIKAPTLQTWKFCSHKSIIFETFGAPKKAESKFNVKFDLSLEQGFPKSWCIKKNLNLDSKKKVDAFFPINGSPKSVKCRQVKTVSVAPRYFHFSLNSPHDSAIVRRLLESSRSRTSVALFWTKK